MPTREYCPGAAGGRRAARIYTHIYIKYSTAPVVPYLHSVPPVADGCEILQHELPALAVVLPDHLNPKVKGIGLFAQCSRVRACELRVCWDVRAKARARAPGRGAGRGGRGGVVWWGGWVGWLGGVMRAGVRACVRACVDGSECVRA
jgi:hypothetical protein